MLSFLISTPKKLNAKVYYNKGRMPKLRLFNRKVILVKYSGGWYKIKLNIYNLKYFNTFAPRINEGTLAQLVEQRTENPCVTGSIPVGTTK